MSETQPPSHVFAIDVSNRLETKTFQKRMFRGGGGRGRGGMMNFEEDGFWEEDWGPDDGGGWGGGKVQTIV